MTYETMRQINGSLNLLCAFGLAIMAGWLLWRGGHEKPHWKPIPGRIVVGAFLMTYAAVRIEEGFWRIFGGGGFGSVGRRVNEPWTLALLAAATLLCAWSFVRFLRNDLESRSV